jgi:hypothetical protein
MRVGTLWRRDFQIYLPLYKPSLILLEIFIMMLYFSNAITII